MQAPTLKRLDQIYVPNALESIRASQQRVRYFVAVINKLWKKVNVAITQYPIIMLASGAN